MTDRREERRISSWGDLFVQTLELGLGAASLTAESAQRLVHDLVQRGKMNADESESMVDRLLSAGREQREAMRGMVDRAVDETLVRMDLARRSDLDALRRRVDDLEQHLSEHRVAGHKVPPAGDAVIKPME
jgi:polyhydroxyalkanoate synthesis regulator phasin